MSAWKPRYCERCSVAIRRPRTAKDSCKYCSKKCYFDSVREGKQQFKGKVYDAWTNMFDWFGEWEQQRPKPRKERSTPPRAVRPTCIQCGIECNHMAARFCSYACNKAWRGPRLCKCGTLVEQATAYGKDASCQPCRLARKKTANRRAKVLYGRNHRDRARHHGVRYQPVPVKAVYNRDDWRCQLCGCKCKRRATWSKIDGRIHPMSPTIDHIVPMSLGGHHEPGNLQTACFQCNTRKGATSRGQLRMAFI
jgi:hypothetical protein